MKKKILAAGGLVFNQQNELLLICRRSKWDLPKGHLDAGETLEQCALREVKEETGLTQLTIIKFIGIIEHEVYEERLKSDAIKETHWFEMKGDKNESFHPQFSESIEWIKWVSKADIEQYLHNSYKTIRDIIYKAV